MYYCGWNKFCDGEQQLSELNQSDFKDQRHFKISVRYLEEDNKNPVCVNLYTDPNSPNPQIIPLGSKKSENAHRYLKYNPADKTQTDYKSPRMSSSSKSILAFKNSFVRRVSEVRPTKNVDRRRSQGQVLREKERSQIKTYEELVQENRRYRRIIQNEYKPMKGVYRQLLKQEQDRNYMISHLEWKVKQLGQEMKKIKSR